MNDNTAAGRRTLANFSGCLLGGAVGDALGAAIEFESLEEIRERYGQRGLTDFAWIYARTGAITDDTQMTLFTAEALLRSRLCAQDGSSVALARALHRSYLRWLLTQAVPVSRADASLRSGWLLDLPELNSRRAPGTTCLSALQAGTAGAVDRPVNDSKGCGGIMRVAPVGLVAPDPFELGCAAAAITHGQPSGYLAAGTFAAVLAGVIEGASLEAAIARATEQLRRQPEHAECLAAVEAATALAERGVRTAEAVEQLGGGWVGEEALAIALFCALGAESFEDGVLLAVNHGGDSDSTGSLAGNLLGALLGVGAIPARWLAGLELRDAIEQVASDLFDTFVLGRNPDQSGNRQRYPCD